MSEFQIHKYLKCRIRIVVLGLVYAIFLRKKISFVKIYALCREIHFVAIYALLCGEKFIQKFSLWRKNDKYEVCFEVEGGSNIVGSALKH